MAAKGRKGPNRRAFLSASAATAVAAPLITVSTSASAATGARSVPARGTFDRDLRAMLSEIDPDRIGATILRLTQFGTRHTASSQTDPVRGIGAATAWAWPPRPAHLLGDRGRRREATTRSG